MWFAEHFITFSQLVYQIQKHMSIYVRFYLSYDPKTTLLLFY